MTTWSAGCQPAPRLCPRIPAAPDLRPAHRLHVPDADHAGLAEAVTPASYSRRRRFSGSRSRRRSCTTCRPTRTRSATGRLARTSGRVVGTAASDGTTRCRIRRRGVPERGGTAPRRGGDHDVRAGPRSQKYPLEADPGLWPRLAAGGQPEAVDAVKQGLASADSGDRYWAATGLLIRGRDAGTADRDRACRVAGRIASVPHLPPGPWGSTAPRTIPRRHCQVLGEPRGPTRTEPTYPC